MTKENKYIYIGDYNPTANGHDASIIQFPVTKPKQIIVLHLTASYENNNLTIIC
jgi:hypothetical protein